MFGILPEIAVAVPAFIESREFVRALGNFEFQLGQFVEAGIGRGRFEGGHGV